MIKFTHLLAFLTCGIVYCQNIPERYRAEEGYFGPEKKIIKLDPFSKIPTTDIPQDRTLYIRMYFNAGLTLPNKAYLIDGDRSVANCKVYEIKKDATSKDEDNNLKIYDAVDILIPALKPYKSYELFVVDPGVSVVADRYIDVLYEIDTNIATSEALYNSYNFRRDNLAYTSYATLQEFYTQKNIAGIFTAARGALGPGAAKAAIVTHATPFITGLMDAANFIDLPGGTLRQTVFLDGALISHVNAKPSKIETSAPLTLIADAGVVYCGFQKGFSVVTPYVGVCISLRSYDPELRFRRVNQIQHLQTWERLSFHLGLTLNSFAKEHYRDNIYGTNNILAGISYRFSNVVCLTGGGVFYNNLDPNPLITKKTVGFAPYVGLSINLKIKSALGDIAKVFGYGK